MEGRNLIQEPLQINSKNILGWLSLAIVVCDLSEEERDKIEMYLRRTDKVRRQHEIDMYWR